MEMLRGASGPFAMILTDIVMRGKSGVDLARDIVALDPGARVLFMSGYADDEALVQYIASSRTPFLAKPFAVTTLLQTVRRVLDTPQRSIGAPPRVGDPPPYPPTERS
jgi:DNA-binding NtrC family response regulator